MPRSLPQRHWLSTLHRQRRRCERAVLLLVNSDPDRLNPKQARQLNYLGAKPYSGDSRSLLLFYAPIDHLKHDQHKNDHLESG
jgi:hypothetical protein